MDESIKFARQLMSFPDGSLELKQEELKHISETLSSMLQLLKTPTGNS
jgi:hypothetical protein